MKHALLLLISPEHECSYLPGRQSCSLAVSPDTPMTTKLYNRLVQLGYRRSGDNIYRPHCPACNACIPIRVPVKQFQPNRSQRRNLKTNADLIASPMRTQYRQEHYDLYQRYLDWRHADGLMADSTPEEYQEYLTSDWCNAWLIEFRVQGRLLAVAAIDQLLDGLSAVYTFYEPAMAERGLGDYAVLWQIGHAQELGLDYVYLGYWIAECRKMAYKQRYKPFEVFQDDRGWMRYSDLPRTV